jgi:hypothetical protein
VLLVIGLAVAGCAQHRAREMQPGKGWTTLIDGGKGLENWNRVGDANWRSEGDAIVADKGKDGYLVSKNSYKDFQIRAEFWADTTTNSGIFIRAQDPNNIAPATSYEVNIYDLRPDPSYGTGGIVDIARVSPVPKAGGKWNTYLITARGTNLVVELNGEQTVNVNDSKFSSGPFALQFGNGPKDAPGGPIKWRKLQVREF